MSFSVSISKANHQRTLSLILPTCRRWDANLLAVVCLDSFPPVRPHYQTADAAKFPNLNVPLLDLMSGPIS